MRRSSLRPLPAVPAQLVRCLPRSLRTRGARASRNRPLRQHIYSAHGGRRPGRFGGHRTVRGEVGAGVSCAGPRRCRGDRRRSSSSRCSGRPCSSTTSRHSTSRTSGSRPHRPPPRLPHDKHAGSDARRCRRSLPPISAEWPSMRTRRGPRAGEPHLRAPRLERPYAAAGANVVRTAAKASCSSAGTSRTGIAPPAATSTSATTATSGGSGSSPIAFPSASASSCCTSAFASEASGWACSSSARSHCRCC